MKTGIFQGSKWFAGFAGATLLLSFTVQKTDAQVESVATNAPESSSQAPDEMTEPPSAPVIPSDLSPGVADIVKLAQAQVDDTVMLAYITNEAANVHLTADEIVYLTDLGVSDKVIAALLQRSNTTASENTQPEAPEEEQPAAPAPAQETPPAPPATPDAPASAEAPVAPAPPVDASAQVEPPQPVSTEYFYDSLAPYGSWVDVPDYGLCWQPTVVVVNPGWRPYCDHGHWVYTDCGWYWQSDYTWGWAPFHYGRWVFHGRHGWVWRPDGVWGPSWVSWRQTDAYFGWAPLPPEARFHIGVGLSFHGHLDASIYTFVESRHFYDRRPDHFRVPEHQVSAIFRASVSVGEIRSERSRAFNPGFGRERIAIATHREIRPVSIRTVTVAHSPGTPGRMEHFENGGKTLTVVHPRFDAGRPLSPGRAKPPVLINSGPRIAAPNHSSAFSNPRPSPFNHANGIRPAPKATAPAQPSHREIRPPKATPGESDHSFIQPKRQETPSNAHKFNAPAAAAPEPRPAHSIQAPAQTRPAAPEKPVREFKTQNSPPPSAPAHSAPEHNERTFRPPAAPAAPVAPRAFTPPAPRPPSEPHAAPQPAPAERSAPSAPPGASPRSHGKQKD